MLLLASMAKLVYMLQVLQPSSQLSQSRTVFMTYQPMPIQMQSKHQLGKKMMC